MSPKRDLKSSGTPGSLSALVERVCAKFAEVWRVESCPNEDEMLEEVPIDMRSVVFGKLVQLDLEMLRSSGHSPSFEQMKQRFPKHESVVSMIWDRASETRAYHPEETTSDSVVTATRYRNLKRFQSGGMGGSSEFEAFPNPKFTSAIRALDPTTGKLQWEYPMMPKSTAGVLSTAGNLVFSGTAKGVFFALDARTGNELWRVGLGARVHASPVTYQVEGRQYVTIAAGNAFFTFSQ